MFDVRRFLTDFDSARMGNMLAEVLVIGSGVAGARAAIEAARYGSVTMLTKGAFDESATHHAQGGIAAAIGPQDSPQTHFDDTMRVGCGLNNPEAVRLLVDEGPRCIEQLLEWGMKVDRTDKTTASPRGLSLGREGGHTVDRILHAQGDQTGKALVRTLEGYVRRVTNIRLFEHCFLLDLITRDNVCLGAVTFHLRHGHQLIWAKQTILASGGCGQLWRETTNPPSATGDGLSAAFRAGATLCDLEMMQFHPTTLYIAGAGRALISEAVRGQNAYLVDREGHRFMQDHHPDAELAPRDVVSRAIHQHLRTTRSNCVYLDVRHIPAVAERFPQIARLCADFGIDVTHDLIPVRPSAHYMIGGVDVDLSGCSSIEGLLCCGEVARTGVHGANRLASNSLLEGLVFGKAAGQTAGRKAASAPQPPTVETVANRISASKRTELDLPDIRNSLRSVMWRNVGIVRDGSRLHETCDIINFWGHYTLDKTFNERAGWETLNMLTLGRLVAMAALERAESIGVHHRVDAPTPGAMPTLASSTPGPAKPCEASVGMPRPYHLALTRDSTGTTPSRIAD